MKEKEMKPLRKQIKQEQEEVKHSKEAAKKFLMELGILASDGNF